MKKILTALFVIFLVVEPSVGGTNSGKPDGYIIGGIIALLILVYLIYSIIRPEKF